MTYTQICPRCNQPNRCGYSEDNQAPGCWCTKLTISEPLLRTIREKWGSDSCICKECLEELIEEEAKSAK